mmetsp:Transcript_21674/g.61410  ORF Transcript_21674/g.61410 Transcript_21674/m.61410 type:complete len:106 (+) Transcript_21674:108-425(+)
MVPRTPQRLPSVQHLPSAVGPQWNALAQVLFARTASTPRRPSSVSIEPSKPRPRQTRFTGGRPTLSGHGSAGGRFAGRTSAAAGMTQSAAGMGCSTQSLQPVGQG